MATLTFTHRNSACLIGLQGFRIDTGINYADLVGRCAIIVLSPQPLPDYQLTLGSLLTD